jgi:soluble lytic murein transglycosylase-like protein
MANFLRRLITVQVPAHRLPRERTKLMVLAALAAVLGVVASYRAILASDALVAPLAAAKPAEPGQASGPDPLPERDSQESPRQRLIAEHLAKRYRVSADALQEMVEAAHQAGGSLRLDPLLIIAVMAVESSFNPIAESVAGAKGLMQVIPRYHQEKLEPLGGEKAVLDPRSNILVGALILREYLDRTGDLTTALQLYAGARDDPDTRYTRKVLNEHQRLKGLAAQARA